MSSHNFSKLHVLLLCPVSPHKLQSLLFLEGSISTVAPNAGISVGSSSDSGEFLAEDAGLGTNGREPSSQQSHNFLYRYH